MPGPSNGERPFNKEVSLIYCCRKPLPNGKYRSNAVSLCRVDSALAPGYAFTKWCVA